MYDLTQAAGDMFGNLGFKLLNLDVDLKFFKTAIAFGNRGMPTGRHQIALGKQFKNARHNVGFCGGMDGKTKNGFGGLRVNLGRSKSMIGHGNAHGFSVHQTGEQVRPGVLRQPGK